MIKAVILTFMLLSQASASEEVSLAIREASLKTDIKYETLAKFAYIESRYNPKARNSKSSARGLFQIIKTTQSQLEEKYDLHGDIYNPFYNALLAAVLAKETRSYYQKKGFKKISEVDYYLAHFVGAYGSYKLKTVDQNKRACTVVKTACRSHKKMFKNKTVKEFRQYIQNKLDNAKVI